MNAVLWAWHIAVLYYSWPLLRAWWDGAVVLDREIERKRWLVALSIGMPPFAAIWLLPFAIAHRADLCRQERLEPVKWTEQRAADVAFWREQVATGDLVSAWVGIELLAMWHAPVVESEAARVVPVLSDQHGMPQALPGAHEYSHDCGCRNCVRARRRTDLNGPCSPVCPEDLHCRMECLDPHDIWGVVSTSDRNNRKVEPMKESMEAVDFYSGHKDTLTYLGTAWVENGAPEAIQARQRFTDESLPEGELFVEADYLAAVEQLLASPDRPGSARSWPHPYRNSIKTPWAYRFQMNSVLIYQGGHLVQTILCNGSREPYQYFPNLGS